MDHNKSTGNPVLKRVLLFLRGTCRCSVRGICLTSKSALLLLFCTFMIFMVLYWTVPGVTVQFMSFLYYSGVTSYIPPERQPHLLLAVCGLSALTFILYPIGGYCGDVKWGRYRVVKHSMCVSLILLVVSMPIGIMLTATFAYRDQLFSVLLSWIGLLMLLCVGLMFAMGQVCFAANIIQFGIDQLLDSPSHHQSLFIHWFVWVLYVSHLLTQVGQIAVTFLAGEHINLILVTALFVLFIVLLSVLYCLVRCKQHWFLIEPGQVNPYKLVYQVTDFAHRHRTPLNRSAFTYCEDEWPTRLDLGKQKYGGTYMTGEVEDVKTFYGMLKVLLALGPVFFLRVATDTTSPLFHPHMDNFVNFTTSMSAFSAILHGNTLFTPLVVILSIPLYLCALRPYIARYLPKMLNRIAIGILMDVMVVVSKLMLNIITMLNRLHSSKEGACRDIPCEAPFYLEAPFLIIELVLSALSSMFIYVALYEFICAQSPNAMKGMLIGLSYTIQGMFQLMGTLAILPFLLWSRSSPDRAFGYYLFNLVIGILILIVYVIIARRYKYRVRDEPSREWEYAEAYYSSPELSNSIFQ